MNIGQAISVCYRYMVTVSAIYFVRGKYGESERVLSCSVFPEGCLNQARVAYELGAESIKLWTGVPGRGDTWEYQIAQP
jgi:hypothetical protein